MINMENLTSFTSGQTEPLEVDVYRNLHRACYSIKDRSTNRLIPQELWSDGTHTAPEVVQNVTFKVLEGGRLRVVEAGIKTCTPSYVGHGTQQRHKHPQPAQFRRSLCLAVTATSKHPLRRSVITRLPAATFTRNLTADQSRLPTR